MPGVGEKAAAKLWDAFNSENGDSQVAGAVGLAERLERCSKVVPKKAAGPWAQFKATLGQLAGLDGKPREMIQLVLEAGYDHYLESAYDNFQARKEDLVQLGSFGREFGTLDEFLSQVSLLTSVEAEHQKPASNEGEALRLSTIHQAKGLEFDAVFVIMLCDGLFPSERSVETPGGEEEERRLLYVAITRARNDLYLSFPLVRSIRGGGDSAQRPSRFLKEIPRELLEEWDLRV
jgi:DNA helicase-2/ATP-dependent DNA helicase PcrA